MNRLERLTPEMERVVAERMVRHAAHVALMGDTQLARMGNLGSLLDALYWDEDETDQ